MKSSKSCGVCGEKIHAQAYCCKRCKKFLDRVDTRRRPDKKARLRALKKAWDGNGFCCYYSGIRLVEDDPSNPRYLTFDHRTPRDERDVVVTEAVLSDMKSDLTEQEFRNVIMQLASRFEGGTFDENVFKLKHWKR